MVLNKRNVAAFLLSEYYIFSGKVKRINSRAASGEFILSVYFHDPSKKLFESCVTWFKNHGYSFISTDDLVAIASGNLPFPSLAVLFTVDDGWKDNKANIAAIANKHKVPVTILRNGKEQTVTVSLKNKAGNYDVVKKDALADLLGAEFITLDPRKAREYGVSGGVFVKKIKDGAINDQTRMKDGFVILKVNNKEVKSIIELKDAIGSNKTVTISGFYPGFDALYEYPLTLGE